MAHLIWQDSYNTGIEVIDDQHKQLLDYLNKLDSARSTKNMETIRTVIGDLSDYTMSHFAFEEALMEQASYPFATAHKSVHETFVKRVAGFQERFENGEDVVEEFYGLLKRWLINHIQRDDMAYAPTIKKHLELTEPVQESAAVTEKKESWLKRAVKKFFG